MCGIVGWIDWQHDLTCQGTIINRMADTLNHRGPDAGGQWLAPHAALAHRRLIVIDPETGAQPMVYQEGEKIYAITYNGEIYNFRDLRCELESYGHRFRTCSDTEVLLHAYVEWGETCVQHLNGIFAFGLWDEQQQQLLLARDHIGVKPLFYAQRGNTLLFSSELKALLAHPLVKAEVDASGLAEILTFVRIPDSGIYRDVHALRPGHIAICREQGIRISRYWSLQSAPHTDDLDTTTAYILSLLTDTVKRQLIADVPVVSMLSGGLDSSALTALAAREFKREGKTLHTYSIDFVDSSTHFHATPLHVSLDAPWARRVSDHVGSQHHTVTVDSSTMIENLLVPLFAHDFPTAGQMTTSLYLLFKAMKQDATVTLSGESADEVFGGYPWFHNDTMLKAQTFPWLSAFIGPGESARSWLSADLVQRMRPEQHIEQQYHMTIAEVPKLEGEEALEARRREMFYLNQTHFLPFLLERKDRMSMATGFEARVPFCDYRLVEYVWNIPWQMKTIDNREKGILRRALAGVLPDDVLSRKKSAYPTFQSPAYQEATRIWAQHILNDASAPILPLLNVQMVRTVVENKEPLPAMALVSLYECIIQLNEWLKQYQVRLAL
ncbi:MAG TPA: asparagine synthase (glutamine-hydrolyzing) [Ktedonobacteraceae bacterium]|nr:asparagine synthase (glutamine-hydrolyzing) [Ktedonobacteraceae bacterium]